MSTVAPALMTTEEMLALREDGMERELVCGELREKPMTQRNRRHGRSTIRIGSLLDRWLEQQPEPCGEIVGGECGFRLRRNPDTSVGIDVAYVGPDVVLNETDARFFEGPPVLAVEILSPSDDHEEISRKVRLYQEAGVPLVWVVDTIYKTILVHRLDQEPELFNVRQDISAEPFLPGFCVPVARLFQI